MFESEFDEWIKRVRKLFEEMDKTFEEIFREPMIEEEKGGDVKHRVYGPYYYGFSVTVGPDGIPRIREWGNIKPGIGRIRVSDTIEPFTDVMEEEEEIKIIMDLPGVEKEDIDVEVSEEEVRVSAERGDRKYFKLVKLPAKVKPETAKAQYRNGVFTVTIEKVEKRKKKKREKVKVE